MWDRYRLGVEDHIGKGTPTADGTPKPPSRGKLRAQALEQARRERKRRTNETRLGLLGLRRGWLDGRSVGGSGDAGGSGMAGGAAPPAIPGQYSDLSRPPADLAVPGARRGGWRRAFGPRRTVVLLVALVVVIVVVAAHRGRSGPALARSCTTPALAVAPTAVAASGVVRYTATGPADALFAIALDAAGVRRRADGTYAAVGTAPGARSQAVGLGRLPGCRTSGAFVVQLAPGPHRVTMFRLTGATATPVASQPLTVTLR